jgi:hypothetical protein
MSTKSASADTEAVILIMSENLNPVNSENTKALLSSLKSKK